MENVSRIEKGWGWFNLLEKGFISGIPLTVTMASLENLWYMYVCVCVGGLIIRKKLCLIIIDYYYRYYSL